MREKGGRRRRRRGLGRGRVRCLPDAFLAVALLVGPSGQSPAAALWVAHGAVATTSFTAKPDWLAPLVQSSVIAKSTGYLTGSIKQAGTYYVYANLIDSGQPASGVGPTTADVSLITATGTAVPLVAGAYSAGGVSYGYRSGAQVAITTLAQGSRAYSITSRDAAGNSRTQTGFTVNVDNTAAAASDVQTTNGAGGVNGRAETGDRVSFTYSETVDPQSILAGWTGPSTNVVVRLVDGGCITVVVTLTCADDSLVVYNATNTSQLPLGSVDLKRGDYYGTALGTLPPLTFGATGTPSTMVQSGSTITVTFGTASASGSTTAAAAAMVWTPLATSYDAAGNLTLATAATETGTADKDF